MHSFAREAIVAYLKIMRLFDRTQKTHSFVARSERLHWDNLSAGENGVALLTSEEPKDPSASESSVCIAHNDARDIEHGNDNGGDVRNVVKRSAWVLSALFAFFSAFFSIDVNAADAPLERAPDTMQARVLGCAACHGAHGEGTDSDYFPRLSGKPAGYLYNQLLAFRDGRRKYPPMNYLLAYLPDAYLKQIADYFAGERPPFPPPSAVTVDTKTLDLGKSLVTKGDAARKIPACVSCHGPLMTGMEPAIPGLLGLHSDYISAQLGAWRYGTRTTIAPDCMAHVSRLLSDRDITAIAAYLASVPAPTDANPIPAGSLKMPLACGSVQP